MQAHTDESLLGETATVPEGACLRLLVHNHPGVMSHVCGLFARRAFNVEGILCLPLSGGELSVILLIVHEADRLDQMMRQLRKLEDVIEVAPCTESRKLFSTLARHVNQSA